MEDLYSDVNAVAVPLLSWRMNMLKLKVPDMSCGHCAGVITKAVKSVDANAEVKVDIADKTVSINSSAAAPAVSKAIESAGYPNSTM